MFRGSTAGDGLRVDLGIIVWPSKRSVLVLGLNYDIDSDFGYNDLPQETLSISVLTENCAECKAQHAQTLNFRR